MYLSHDADIVVNPEKAKKWSKSNNSAMTYDDSDDSDSDYIDENAFGGFAGFNIKFNNLKALKEVQLGKYDAEYEHLTVVDGLNLKALCANKNCKAYQSKKTWIQKGHGCYNIAEVRFGNKCRGCQQELDWNSITSFGFTRARIQVKGIVLDENHSSKEYDKEF